MSKKAVKDRFGTQKEYILLTSQGNVCKTGAVETHEAMPI